MAKSPDSRPSSPEEVVELLRPWRSELELSKAVRNAKGDPVEAKDTGKKWRATKKPPEIGKWIGAGVAVALLILGIGWLFTQENSTINITSSEEASACFLWRESCRVRPIHRFKVEPESKRPTCLNHT